MAADYYQIEGKAEKQDKNKKWFENDRIFMRNDLEGDAEYNAEIE